MRAARLTLGAILALSIVTFLLQLTIVKPFVWPAGAGLTLSTDAVFASFEAPRAVPRMRPPDAPRRSNEPIVITDIRPGGVADRARLQPGMHVSAIRGGGQSLDLSHGLPSDASQLLTRWRDAYWLRTRGPVAITIDEGPPSLGVPASSIGAGGTAREVVLEREAVWEVTAETRRLWLRTHAGVLVQTAGFLAGAIALVALGASGMTATLTMLALIVTAIANAGSLMGSERSVPILREILVLFGWLATPLAFPIIGLAVLHFPARAPILDRHRWIPAALAAATAPMLAIGLLAALFLIGIDAVLPALAWLSTHGWSFDVSFVVALAANVLIVVEGITRYRGNLDANERRRIQLIVFTGVPAVFAYAIRAGVPLLSSLAGRPMALHWLVETVLQAIVLLPALSLPYAVAVTHVFSPRTVLRRSLQYALARRTLSILVVLPIAALLVSLIADRDRPLADIILGQPLFYLFGLALAGLGLRYRDDAQRWLDRRFFRAEYDAREILVELASRVPYENEPSRLVAMVLTQIDSALHPESAAVLAGDADRLDVVSTLRCELDPLPREGALATLLRWSDEPLAVFLDEERSPVARLPQADRLWLQKTGTALLVPIFTGTGDSRLLVGMLVLGHKRSEEPYTAEDRRLLSGIAAQMSVALDLSRLRRRASETTAAPTVTPTGTPTMLMGGVPASPPALAMCPKCQRCFDLMTLHGLPRRSSGQSAGAEAGPRQCPDDGAELTPVLGMPPVVDGKYRVDSMIGRGGMGAVFRARDLRLDRDVAIKIVRADLVADPDSRARFRREAQIVARLQHPAIVTVFDFGTLPDGAAFLVMEFVRGEDLRHLLRRETTLSAERTTDLIIGIAMGVEAAHQAGVLHRDLKPENVLLPASGSGPKVLDFGVAKITDTFGESGTISQGHTIVGTPAYMAPEQLRGEKVDGRADVFSLAVMTYEALTGRVPFGMGSLVEVGIQQAGGASSLDTSGLPPHLAPAIAGALAINRDERPAGPAAFAEALRKGG